MKKKGETMKEMGERRRNNGERQNTVKKGGRKE